MQEILNWQIALISSWERVLSSILGIIPIVLGAIIIFSVGLILAYWIKRFVIRFLEIIGVRKFSRRLNFEELLRKAEIKVSFIELLGVLVEWIVIFIFFLTAMDILGLKVVSEVLMRVLSYVPNIFAAIFIFGAGYFVAGFVEKLVRATLVSVNHEVAKPVAKFTRWLLIVVFFFAAIDQLRIAQRLISIFFQGLTYTIVLIVGLSVGLGAKDLVAKILEEWYEKVKK